MNAIDLLIQPKDERAADPNQAGIPGARAANDALAAEFAGALADAGQMETSATAMSPATPFDATPTTSTQAAPVTQADPLTQIALPTQTAPLTQAAARELGFEDRAVAPAAKTVAFEKPRMLDAVRGLERSASEPRRAPTKLAGTPKLSVAAERPTRARAPRGPNEDLLGWLASRFEVLDTGADRAPKAELGLSNDAREGSDEIPTRAEARGPRTPSLLAEALPWTSLDLEGPEATRSETTAFSPTAAGNEAPTLRPPALTSRPSSDADEVGPPSELPLEEALDPPLFMPADVSAHPSAVLATKTKHSQPKRHMTPHQGTRAALSAAAIDLTPKATRSASATPDPHVHAPTASHAEIARARSAAHEHPIAVATRKHASPVEGPRPALAPTVDGPETTFVAGPVVAPAIPAKEPPREAEPGGRGEPPAPTREKLARATSVLDEVHLQLATREEPSEALDRESPALTRSTPQDTTVEGGRIPLPLQQAQPAIADRARDASPEKQAPFALPTTDAETRARRQDDAEAAANRMTLDRKVEARTVTEDLGTVTVTAEPRRGEVTMSVVASRPETAALIAQNRAPITEDLRTHAMEVGALNVSVDSGQGRSTRGEDQRERSNRSSRRSLTPVSGTPRTLDSDPFAVAARRVRIVL